MAPRRRPARQFSPLVLAAAAAAATCTLLPAPTAQAQLLNTTRPAGAAATAATTQATTGPTSRPTTNGVHGITTQPGGGLMLTFFKVNDHQYIEVFPDWKGPEQLVLSHIAFETDNIQQLRDYLDSKGVKVPAALHTGLDGNVSFMIKDPDGHDIEFVQYMPGSLHSRNFGKAMPATRVSERIIHVGTTVSDRAAFDALYRDILGFREFWHGGMTDDETNWVDMRVPDGTDWFEYMLNVKNPTAKTLGVMNHMALGVPSVKDGYKTVLDRGLTPAQGPKIGRDGKWQLNLYDANLTRAELMEPKPVQKPCCSPVRD